MTCWNFIHGLLCFGVAGATRYKQTVAGVLGFSPERRGESTARVSQRLNKQLSLFYQQIMGWGGIISHKMFIVRKQDRSVLSTDLRIPRF